MTTAQRTRTWRVPAALITLSLVPVAAGAFRLGESTAGTRVTPVAMLLHIIGASVYCVLGAFQFIPVTRRHRLAGRFLVPCGLVAALSGVWMAVFHRPEDDSALLTVLRVGFGTAMAVALVLGVMAVRRRRFGVHRVWMIRGYAIALGAGSQAVVFGLWAVVAGTPGEFGTALLMGAGWVINLAVAEWIIREKR
jgi:hypothetical protein